MNAPRKDVVLGHSEECDGIEEYDNRLPNWWVGLFVICVIYGVFYGINYHFVAQTSQAQAYDAEVAAAEEQWPTPSAEDAMASATSPEAIEAGKAIFATNCIGCHGADGTGGIGPNLTDAEWIHGGTMEAINKTVTDGVPEKGMVAWGSILGPAKIAQVSAFVHSMGGGT
jgi:cytochrome c oxidase cbb3-type subunit 3